MNALLSNDDQPLGSATGLSARGEPAYLIGPTSPSAVTMIGLPASGDVAGESHPAPGRASKNVAGETFPNETVAPFRPSALDSKPDVAIAGIFCHDEACRRCDRPTR